MRQRTSPQRYGMVFWTRELDGVTRSNQGGYPLASALFALGRMAVFRRILVMAGHPAKIPSQNTQAPHALGSGDRVVITTGCLLSSRGRESGCSGFSKFAEEIDDDQKHWSL